MTVGILKETFPGERRVAVIPAGVATLKKAGIAVVVEPGAGTSAGFPDDQYVAQGATVGGSRADVIAQADCLLQVRTPGANPVSGRADAEALRPGQVIVGMADPLGTPEAADYLAAKGVTSFALELIPRITRAQSMDVLSSMATVAGLQGGAPGRQHHAAHVPDAHDRRRHGRAGACVRHRGRRRRPAGDRLGAAHGRQGRGLRRPAGRQGTDPEPRRQVRRAAARVRRGRGQGRLRQGAGRGVLPEAARADGQVGRGGRHGDHDRGDPGQEVTGPDHRRRGEGHAARLGDRRSRRRARRQLRADEGRRDGRRRTA